MSGNNENNCKDKTRWLDDQDVIRADVAKLHNEVNQLRNQELLINSFAITAVAILATVPIRHVCLSALYLFMLFGIGYWQYNCLVTRSIITGYLMVFDLSQWEKDYHARYIEKQLIPSMKKATALLFIILGFVVSSFPCFISDNGGTRIISPDLKAYVSFGVYFILCVWACFNGKGSLAEVKGKWEEKIKKDFKKEGQTVISSMTISPEHANFFYKTSGHDGEPDLEFVLTKRKQPTKTPATPPE